MAVDEIVRDSITKAVEEGGQPKSLATRLISWLDRLSEGRSTLSNKGDVSRHVTVVLKATKTRE